MRKISISKILYYFVLVSFVVPIVYLIYRIVTVPEGISGDDMRSRADYVLMLVQCVLGIFVIHVPSILARKLQFELPSALSVMYIIFLYCAIFLGEVRDFYYAVPHWDVILHCFSSMMTGMFGYMMVSVLNEDKHIGFHLSPIFVALFAFSFSVMIGAVWEIYEFTFDGVLGLNMQKFMLKDGTELVGRAALSDTMKDIIVDCIGALISTCLGYVSIKNKKGWAYSFLSEHAGEGREM